MGQVCRELLKKDIHFTMFSFLLDWILFRYCEVNWTFCGCAVPTPVPMQCNYINRGWLTTTVRPSSPSILSKLPERSRPPMKPEASAVILVNKNK